MYKDPQSSTTNAAESKEPKYNEWITKSNLIATQRPFSNNEKKFSGAMYVRSKCADVDLSKNDIWTRIYKAGNGEQAMTQKRVC